MKLSQCLALEQGKKKQFHSNFSDLHHRTQKPDLMTGHHKSYTPKDDDGETFPDDLRRVVLLHQRVLAQVSETLIPLLDLTATKDWGNTLARANIMLDDHVFLEDVPVPFLLFLEKELRDLATFVEKMVELDPGEQWVYDPVTEQHRSETPIRTQRTKKVPRGVVLHPATKEHPAQTQLVHEDTVIGTWTTTRFSGAISGPRKEVLLARIHQLEDAVKLAREQANSTEVIPQNVGRKLMSFILEDVS